MTADGWTWAVERWDGSAWVEVSPGTYGLKWDAKAMAARIAGEGEVTRARDTTGPGCFAFAPAGWSHPLPPVELNRPPSPDSESSSPERED